MTPRRCFDTVNQTFYAVNVRELTSQPNVKVKLKLKWSGSSFAQICIRGMGSNSVVAPRVALWPTQFSSAEVQTCKYPAQNADRLMDL